MSIKILKEALKKVTYLLPYFHLISTTLLTFLLWKRHISTFFLNFKMKINIITVNCAVVKTLGTKLSWYSRLKKIIQLLRILKHHTDLLRNFRKNYFTTTVFSLSFYYTVNFLHFENTLFDFPFNLFREIKVINVNCAHFVRMLKGKSHISIECLK